MQNTWPNEWTSNEQQLQCKSSSILFAQCFLHISSQNIGKRTNSVSKIREIWNTKIVFAGRGCLAIDISDYSQIVSRSGSKYGLTVDSKCGIDSLDHKQYISPIFQIEFIADESYVFIKWRNWRNNELFDVGFLSNGEGIYINDYYICLFVD